MSTPSVSPSLAPENLAPLADAFRVGNTADGAPVFDAGFGAAQAFLHAAHTNATLGTSAAAAIKAASNDPGQARRLQAGWRARFDSTLKAHEAAMSKIDAEASANEDGIAEDLELPQAKTDVTRSLRALGIQTRLRGMGSDKAFTTLSRAIAEGDRETVSAALVAPFASGLDYEQVPLLRQLAEAKFSPQRAARRDAYSKLRGTITRARDVFVESTGSILGAGDSPAARAEASLRRLENVEGQR